MDATLQLFNLDGYSFGTKDLAVPDQESTGREQRQRLFEEEYAAGGMRRWVGALLLSHQNAHPFVLLLQSKTTKSFEVYVLPFSVACVRCGGRLGAGEEETEGLRRILDVLLRTTDAGASAGTVAADGEWDVGECLACWYRPNFETVSVHPATALCCLLSLQYPYLPAHVSRPKESRKFFLVRIPEKRTVLAPPTTRTLL